MAYSDDVRPTILVVDDTPDNLALMSGLLKDRYKVKVAKDGERALKIANSESRPDLILLDIMMPEMDGYEVCRRLKASAETQNIPVIFLTAMSEVGDETLGLVIGAIDYITKPISEPIMLARVDTHLKLKAAADFLRDKTSFLEAEVRRRTEEVCAVQDVTIMAMASLAEMRDSEAGNHIRRTQQYVRALARKLQTNPRFQEVLTDQNIELIFKSAPLHDIGKVGISDSILLKPGPLTHEEFEIMKSHTTIGRDAIEQAERDLGRHVDFLSIAKEIAYSHQEKWDGSGYPVELSGDDIPVAARLMAIADAYDALVSERVYKKAIPHAEAVATIADGKGSHFDPDMVDAFLEIQHEFLAISTCYFDPPPLGATHATAISKPTDMSASFPWGAATNQKSVALRAAGVNAAETAPD